MKNLDNINYLLNIIDEKFLYEIVNNDDISFVERAKDAKLKRIKLRGFNNCVPINQDKFTLSPKGKLFKINGYNKTCDGVFFSIIDDKPIILVFDVKSSRNNESDHILKMKSGNNFVNYIKSTLNIFWGKDFSDFKCYFCIFYPEISPKRGTSLEVDISTDPNNPSYIAVENDAVISARKILGLRRNF
ncbi:hypothetical protein [Psychrobacter sp. I-STPA10]|uniref:hypothetical protein n=1 Tax=Psychrobacter sp. I-STPA10 TaxID=2585769 RepID=UPI001E632C1C|nr:hypothetical protein [Psychrobacter sp. I-STPA10]